MGCQTASSLVRRRRRRNSAQRINSTSTNSRRVSAKSNAVTNPTIRSVPGSEPKEKSNLRSTSVIEFSLTVPPSHVRQSPFLIHPVPALHTDFLHRCFEQQAIANTLDLFSKGHT